MGLWIKCHNRGCGWRNGEKSLIQAKARKENNGDSCLKCGAPLNHPVKGRRYGIEYYETNGKLKRESNRHWKKKDAEYRLNEVDKAKAEGAEIPKRPDAKTTFRDLAEWYLTLARVRAKQSYNRDVRSVGKLNGFFGDCRLRDILPATVEEYIETRLSEPSYRGHKTKPATVVRELACLNHIFTNAIRNGKAERNPVAGVKRPPENNQRDRVLSSDEYARLIAECPDYIQPVVKLAYHTGMRRGEILNLTWDRLDLWKGLIKLLATHTEDGGTKTGEGRTIHLRPDLVEMFRSMPRGLPGAPVFTRQGRPITGSTIRVGLEIACKRAGVEDFTFHDFRHTFTTNMRRAGVHDSVIMAITGHKTTVMFNRYNHVGQDEIRAAMEGVRFGDIHQNIHFSANGPQESKAHNQ